MLSLLKASGGRPIQKLEGLLNCHLKLFEKCNISIYSQNIQQPLFATKLPIVRNIFNRFLSSFQLVSSPKLLENILLKNTNSTDLQTQKRSYAMRLELTEYGIVWKRPEYVPSWKPEKSGDLVPFEDIDKSKPVLALLPIQEEIMKADERTQRLLSLEFSSDDQVLEMAKYRMKRRIQRHQFDENSLEVRISLMTVDIRHRQKILTESTQSTKKKVRRKVQLQQWIDRRKRKIKALRRYDYKRFEWLLEELGLVYKPFPKYQRWVTRKASLRKLVRLHCLRIKNEKLEKYRMELEIMKRPFLEEKRQTLKWIAETEEKLGLPVSVEVPTEEDVIAGSQAAVLKPISKIRP